MRQPAIYITNDEIKERRGRKRHQQLGIIRIINS